MNGGRVALVVAGVAAAVLAVVFLVLRWDDANKIATAVSALAGVAAVGVAVWAGLPAVAGARGGVRVSRTGRATAGPGGRANTGLSAGGPLPDDVRVDRTGDAEGGEANSGVESR
ncbi:hypothetical protein [Thermomonospora umbrina]|uniref:Uncharacterized protein n=1 Tax=Thermomonospora umbrina TaxID=111806 RepID=A0A3D9SLJ8_9ACTN|nr:hypothetical protein [Thermomonospora umbrina]REE96806.1 hypothetical protein DFJ69_2257 [Thermomonospora umbrina]